MSVKTALRVIEIIETYAREKRALPLSELPGCSTCRCRAAWR